MYKILQLGIIVAAVVSFMGTSAQSTDANTSPNDAAKAAVENTIKDCEAKYAAVKTLGEKLDVKVIKKPGMLSLPKAKKEYEAKMKDYEDKVVLKKAFDKNFSEFTKFTNEKIGVRTAKTTQKMIEKNNEYSSNCSRFAEGLTGFVNWALTGKAAKGFDIIYKDWVAEAKKAK